ncbi:cupin domain-containing protein [uncultured Desulfovibrio sp.]|uniref:cupin domain-containing protein n=1 Tax=uncultured Desulfovibrio sp. TaxID=167968 RepID=UPI0026132D99|nr:cupin domain-containing protein [uncultured Desulfovibrio sp.]
MSNYSMKRVDLNAGRVELHDLLQLTGCEVSCNTLPQGASIPFVHRHKDNEELYIVLDGAGMLFIDGEELPLGKGDCFRIAPAGARCIRAAGDCALRYLCIQTKAGSLEGYTMSDGVVEEGGDRPGWLR